jgi:hypothetical protein
VLKCKKNVNSSQGLGVMIDMFMQNIVAYEFVIYKCMDRLKREENSKLIAKYWSYVP